MFKILGLVATVTPVEAYSLFIFMQVYLEVKIHYFVIIYLYLFSSSHFPFWHCMHSLIKQSFPPFFRNNLKTPELEIIQKQSSSLFFLTPTIPAHIMQNFSNSVLCCLLHSPVVSHLQCCLIKLIIHSRKHGSKECV